MRGLMGVGTNRINKYTLGKNTQGISNYLKKVFKKDISVVIAYDCRNNSKELAKIVANVFSSNNIKVYLFSDLRPTPELSFALKYLNCQCGIVLTASHNPPEYNGYKVYWQDGGQIVPPEDQNIIKEINNLEYKDISFDLNSSLIKFIDKNVDNEFIRQSVLNGKLSDDIKLKNKLNQKKTFNIINSLDGIKETENLALKYIKKSTKSALQIDNKNIREEMLNLTKFSYERTK